MDIPGERYLGVVPLFILLALSVANFWDGTTVKDIGRKCEVALEKWIERKLLALSEDE